MIISHKYRYIFLKAAKTGSSAVEACLTSDLGPDDICTPGSWFVGNTDPATRSYDDLEWPLTKQRQWWLTHGERNFRAAGCPDFHIGFQELLQRHLVTEEQADRYHVLAVIRNPFDRHVSWMWWAHMLSQQKDIEESEYADFFEASLQAHFPTDIALEEFVRKHSARYYWRPDEAEVCDSYLRYDRLSDEVRRFCRDLDLPFTGIQRVNNASRKSNAHYSSFYNERTKSRIAAAYKRELDFFGWGFQDEFT
jgi:hypothetical protein